jgi:hypothetical protein
VRARPVTDAVLGRQGRSFKGWRKLRNRNFRK